MSIAMSASQPSGVWSGLTVAVTGASGGFGAFLVRRLVGAGAFVKALDIRRDDHLEFLEDAEASEKVRFISCNICDENTAALADALKDVNVVFHTVACFGDPVFTINKFANPGHAEKMRAVNVESVKRILSVASECRVKAFVHTSSFNAIFTGRREVVNATEELPYPEQSEYLDLYSATKAEGEKLVVAANGKADMLTVCLRPNGIYGPSVRCYALIKTLEGIAPMQGMYISFRDKRGENVLVDWCHVENLALAQLMAAEKLLEKDAKVGGSVYNVSDDVISTNEAFASQIIAGCGWSTRPIIPVPAGLLQFVGYYMEGAAFVLRRMIGLRSCTATINTLEAAKVTMSNFQTIEKAKQELGFSPIPQTQLMEGMREFSRTWAKQYVDIPSVPLPISLGIGVGMAATLLLSLCDTQHFGGFPWVAVRSFFGLLPGLSDVVAMPIESFQKKVLLTSICIPMLAVHFVDAIIAAYLARRQKHLRWMSYGFRTMLFGFGQLGNLCSKEFAIMYPFLAIGAFAVCIKIAIGMD